MKSLYNRECAAAGRSHEDDWWCHHIEFLLLLDRVMNGAAEAQRQAERIERADDTARTF